MTPDLGSVEWLPLAGGALLTGIAKTAIANAGLVVVAIFAATMPPRASTGTVLLLALAGDVYAVAVYRRHANWATLRSLLPAVFAGIVAGAVFLSVSGEALLVRTIGAVILATVAQHLMLVRRGGFTAAPSMPRLFAVGAGSLAGFTSMVANAGGPVLTVFLLRARLPVSAFLGTSAWFFLMVNLAKLPLAVGIGVVTPVGATVAVLLAPLVLAGAWIGVRLSRLLRPDQFETIVLVLAAMGGLSLLVGIPSGR